jgi:hypothetical protein
MIFVIILRRCNIRMQILWVLVVLYPLYKGFCEGGLPDIVAPRPTSGFTVKKKFKKNLPFIALNTIIRHTLCYKWLKTAHPPYLGKRL